LLFRSPRAQSRQNTNLTSPFDSFVAQSGSGTNYFNLYLKAKKYSVTDTNVLPTAGNAISVVAAFFFGIITDRTGHRLWMVIAVQILVLLSNILLSVWNLSTGVLLFAFYLSYAGAAAQPIVIVSYTYLRAFSFLFVFVFLLLTRLSTQGMGSRA
jgi:MFS family permease